MKKIRERPLSFFRLQHGRGEVTAYDRIVMYRLDRARTATKGTHKDRNRVRNKERGQQQEQRQKRQVQGTETGVKAETAVTRAGAGAGTETETRTAATGAKTETATPAGNIDLNTVLTSRQDGASHQRIH